MIQWSGFPRPATWVISVLLLLSLAGCDSGSQQASPQTAVAIDSSDECHLCGMLISRFPGPKGEAYVRGNPGALKFCSTRDLFAYLLQPDVQTIVQAIYVHDMGRTDWQKPDNAATFFTDARRAWYVVGSSRKGAMGHTLASFARQQDAEAFMQQYGGRLLRFDDIDLAVISEAPHPMGDHGQ